MTNYKILGVGHPRTGTGYSSKLINSFGLDVGHEELRKDGLVAWPLVIPFNKFQNGYPWVRPRINYGELNFETVIYNTRDPKNSIPSIVFTEGPSLNDRRKIVDFSKTINEVEMAILSIVTFDEVIKERFPNHFYYRVENEQEKLYDFLSKKYDLKNNYNLPSSEYNTRKHRIGKIDYSIVRPEYGEMINEYCNKYGYEKLY